MSIACPKRIDSLMASYGEIKAAAIESGKCSGYGSLKPLQLEVVAGIVGGRGVFRGGGGGGGYLQGTARVYATVACPSVGIHLKS